MLLFDHGAFLRHDAENPIVGTEENVHPDNIRRYCVSRIKLCSLQHAFGSRGNGPGSEPGTTIPGWNHVVPDLPISKPCLRSFFGRSWCQGVLGDIARQSFCGSGGLSARVTRRDNHRRQHPHQDQHSQHRPARCHHGRHFLPTELAVLLYPDAFSRDGSEHLALGVKRNEDIDEMPGNGAVPSRLTCSWEPTPGGDRLRYRSPACRSQLPQ